MTRRLVVLALVALVGLVAVTPAWAAGTGQGGAGGIDGQFFSLWGTIDAIADDTITVQVEDGSPVVWAYVGQKLAVDVTGSTLFYECDAGGRANIAFGDLAEGDVVNIQGTAADGGFTASRVIVKLDP